MGRRQMVGGSRDDWVMPHGTLDVAGSSMSHQPDGCDGRTERRIEAGQHYVDESADSST
jgi:hypothetical protein